MSAITTKDVARAKRRALIVERVFVRKATKAARTALKQKDCNHADYWMRQVKLRTGKKPPAALQKSLRKCYRGRSVG